MNVANLYDRTVGVQFSGKAQVYPYLVDAEQSDSITIGCRVVVPVALKDDGSLSLTIGTVVELHDEIKESSNKPVVVVITKGALETAKSRLNVLAGATA